MGKSLKRRKQDEYSDLSPSSCMKEVPSKDEVEVKRISHGQFFPLMLYFEKLFDFVYLFIYF